MKEDETISQPNFLHKKSGSYILGINPDFPHEVFQNDTNAVEVIVKGTGEREINIDTVCVNTDITIRNRSEPLKEPVDESKTNTVHVRESARPITHEIKKQLDLAQQRELKERTKNLALQLENLKLQALLDSKTGLVKKLMKELMNVRRVIKFVLKGLDSASTSPEFLTHSETDYRKFEKELQASFLNEALGIDGLTFNAIV